MADTNTAAKMDPYYEAPGGLPDPAAVEVDTDGVEDIEVEIVDDTPEADRREARPEADKVDPDGEDFQKEIEDYSDNAQKRIKELTHNIHEERRAKEAAQRQNNEAVRYAEQVTADNNSLKEGLAANNEVMLEQFGARSDAELETARIEYKEAYEAGETDKLLEAQETISKLHAERAQTLARAVSPAPQPAPAQQQQNIGTPDKRAMDWINANPWYHGETHEDMTGFAIGLHQKLVKQGLDPNIHDEYYAKIDEGMRTVFPDYFSSSDEGGNGGDPNPTPVATGGKKPPPVGGPTRSGSPPRKVQLTATAVALAKRLGLTNKQYAAQVAKEHLTDG
jgi:hypothetical protein